MGLIRNTVLYGILGATLGALLFAASPVAAQMPALLPSRYDVPETEPLPIDGVWKISLIGKRIHIERGRAFAVDQWLHLFVLQVQPGMVVLRNFQRTGAGHYTADDLPLLGPATFELQPDGSMRVLVNGALGPVNYVLTRQSADDPASFEAEIAALEGGVAQPPLLGPSPPDTAPSPPDTAPSPPDTTPAPPSAGGNPLAECQKLGVDPKTADIVCLD